MPTSAGAIAPQTATSRESRELATALANCPAELATVKPSKGWISEIRQQNAEDLNTYEVVFSTGGRAPTFSSQVKNVLKITRSFQRMHCPAGAMDCEGGQTVFTCDLQTPAN